MNLFLFPWSKGSLCYQRKPQILAGQQLKEGQRGQVTSGTASSAVSNLGISGGGYRLWPDGLSLGWCLLTFPPKLGLLCLLQKPRAPGGWICPEMVIRSCRQDWSARLHLLIWGFKTSTALSWFPRHVVSGWLQKIQVMGMP